MSCTHDSAKELFRRVGVSFPRSAKFERIFKILYNNSFESEKRLTAETQAKLLCLVLRELENRISSTFHEKKSKYAFVFVHAKDKARGDHSYGHCLALYSRYSLISRFCIVEDNWRLIENERFGFRFNVQDWTTSIPPRLVKKPFEFSFFITSDGYSTWIKPSLVIKTMKMEKRFKHDHEYDEDWEKI